MSEAIRFLHALSQAFSAMALYAPGHPATRRSVDNLWQALSALLESEEHPIFLFLGATPIYMGRALHELREWPQSRRLSEAGVQRLEFDRSVVHDTLQLFLDRLMVRVTTGEPAPDEAATPLGGIIFGTVAVLEEVSEEPEPGAVVDEAGGRELQINLDDELAAVAFVREEAERGVVARAEAEAVVRILGALLDQHELPQAATAGDFSRYPLVHPVNTALLAMTCGTATGLDRPSRHRLGVAALLHDIGMARLPVSLANQEKLSESERALVETHTVEGARLLLAYHTRGLELAAVVAYEHHLRPDGTGYPQRRFRPAIHWASRLVGACAAFAALRAPRPFRPAWAANRAVRYLEDGAGTVFDADAARLLAGIVRPS